MNLAGESVNRNPLYVNQDSALASNHAGIDNTYDFLMKKVTTGHQKTAENNTYDSVIKKQASDTIRTVHMYFVIVYLFTCLHAGRRCGSQQAWQC